MKIEDFLEKNNLHHAYLIEGIREEIVPEIFNFMEKIGVSTVGNPDFCHLVFDSFNVENARDLKSKSLEMGFSSDLSAQSGKKIYIISVNNFLLDAQNTLLKMFEEPIKDTHFFLIVPDADALLKTFTSRFYLIKYETNHNKELKEAEKFIYLPLKDRITFVKDLLADEEDKENELINTNTPRSKALKFLNALESVLHNKAISMKDIDFFNQIFKAREFLRQPGSSHKNLMESVALSIPIF